MADPLTALGLASNVVQFINYAGNLIDTESVIRKGADVTPVGYRELETITRSLVEFNDGIKFTVTRFRDREEVQSRHQRVKQRLKHAKSAEEKPTETPEEIKDPAHEETLTGIEEELSNLCNECNEVAQELLGALSDLKSKSKDSNKTWNTFRQALLDVWMEKHVDSVSTQLKNHGTKIGENMLASLSEYVRFNKTTYESLLEDSLARMDKENKRFRERIQEAVKNQNDQQQDQHQSQQRLDAVKKQRDEATEKHHYQKAILETLCQTEGKQDPASFSFQLSETARKQRAEIIQRQIVEKLKFHDMRSRYQDISKAHKETFEWVFLGTDPVNGVNGHAVKSGGAEPIKTARAERYEAPPTTSPDDSTWSEFQPQRRGWWNTLLRRRTTDMSNRSPDWDNYRNWLQGDENLYWIKGKPGSGKSTLMKLLHDDERLKNYLQSWRGNSDLVIAGFFFWNSGEVMQMSKDGLLRALLFQAVEDRHQLIPRLFPDRWAYNTLFGPDILPWTLSELEHAFRTLLSDDSRKYFIMIDGLDEFDGSPKDLANLLLECCASGSHVKMCVSSRPWMEFETAFDRRPSLSLEGLTESDIEKYVKDELLANELFRKLWDMDLEESEDLIHEVARRANGVFLWAQLVTRSLIEGLRGDETVKDLESRLEEYPSGLKELLAKTWSRVKEGNFEQSSRILRLIQTADHPMSLLSIHYAEEGCQKALEDDFRAVAPQELNSLADQTRRQLNSQFANLLEVPSYHDKGAWATIQPIHRTVKDFLEREETQDSIKSGSPESDYEIKLALCTGYLRCLKKLDPASKPPFERFEHLATNCLKFSRAVEVEDMQKNLQILTQLDRASTILVGPKNPAKEQWRKKIQSCVPLVSDPHWTNACPSRTGSSTFFDFAFLSGFYSYVENALREHEHSANPEAHRQSNFLAVAIENDRIAIKFVRLLLEHNADPNLPGEFANFKTPWYLLLFNMSTGIDEDSNLDSDERLRLGTLAELFLDHGADPYVTVRTVPAEKILGKVVGRVDQPFADRLVAKCEESRRKNPQMKPKSSKIQRLKKFLKS
ncbi:hypothetical protein GTA08_BOTSDO05040 [Neofusicoccum parvum]|uniref:Uncharacterized protein n=1 Tax=Neofusicoccum parvum TaxID=310453 RepID=A0ACB5RXP7_9PEZI|nr:hypothetical protein GTA08_BOTSDO05040 [Neofusicoccum parvum]